MDKILYISEKEQMKYNLLNMEYAVQSVQKMFDIMKNEDYKIRIHMVIICMSQTKEIQICIYPCQRI